MSESVLPVVILGDVDASAWDVVPNEVVHVVGELFACERVRFVFCSSRTRGEMEVVRRQLALDGPFISEAGSALFVPHNYFGFDVRRARELSGYSAIEFSLPHKYVIEVLHATARRHAIDITTFDDLSVEDVALELHLPLLRARLAKLREYDEPFRAADRSTSSLAQLVAAVRKARLQCREGVPYCHASAGADLGVAAAYAVDLYRRALGEVVTVAIDSSREGADLRRAADLFVPITGGPSPSVLSGVSRGEEARSRVVEWATTVVAMAHRVRNQTAMRWRPRPSASSLGP